VDSSTLSLTFVLEGGGWSTPYPSCFTPREDQYPLYRRLGGPVSWSGWVQKSLPLPGFDPWTVQLVPSRYTIPAHSLQAYVCSTQLYTYTIYSLKMTMLVKTSL